MAWMDCDMCGEDSYTEDNPFVEVKQARLSNPSDWATTLAGHKNCVGARGQDLPSISRGGGYATPSQWTAFFEEGGPLLEGPADPPGIKFTQYLRPNGAKRPIWIEMPPEVEAKAKELAVDRLRQGLRRRQKRMRKDQRA